MRACSRHIDTLNELSDADLGFIMKLADTIVRGPAHDRWTLFSSPATSGGVWRLLILCPSSCGSLQKIWSRSALAVPRVLAFARDRGVLPPALGRRLNAMRVKRSELRAISRLFADQRAARLPAPVHRLNVLLVKTNGSLLISGLFACR